MRLLPAHARTSVHRRNTYRPVLEQLEPRLPTGVVLGLPAWPWAAVSAGWWDQSSPPSEIALVERFADTGPLRRPGDAASDLLVADFDATSRTSSYEIGVDNALSFTPSGLADRKEDDAALTSELT